MTVTETAQRSPAVRPSRTVQAQPPQRQRCTISAVLIVKNEQSVLEDCLQSLAWVDEIIVLDSGSTDRTVEIARNHGAIVHERRDWAGFGIQRQRAQAFASGDYILAIDADERVDDQLRESILAVLENANDDRVYEVVRTDWFLGRFLYASGWHRETHVRLYARDRYGYHDSLVHESLDTQGARTERLGGLLLHYTCRDYQVFLEKQVSYAHAWARERADQGKRSSLSKAVIHAVWTFVRLYVLHGGFLDGRYGFLHAIGISQYVFNKYAALWHYSKPVA